MMPRQLVVCRHGQAEWNVAWRLAREGDTTLLEELMERPPEKAPLTEVGIQQMRLVGEWLHSERFVFERRYRSRLRRAAQSALALNLKGKWVIKEHLNEQRLGIMQYVTPEQREEYLNSLRGSPHLRDPFNFAPVGGESFADVAANRAVPFLEMLEQECKGDESVLVMGHSGTNKMLDYCLRGWTPKEFITHYVHGDNKIFNGMVLHYTRIDPETGEESETLDWVRTCCPWFDKKPTDWQKIERRGPGPISWSLARIRQLLGDPAA